MDLPMVLSMPLRHIASSVILSIFCLATGSARMALAQGSLPAPQPMAPGAEALGRGGAFVAKADSPLALEYNAAGLAELRGTQILVDPGLFLPDASSSPCHHWQDERRRPCYGGLFAVTTDFGVLRRITFTAGLRVPEYVSAYGLSTNVPLSGDPLGALVPYRQPAALFLSPSLAIGMRALPRLSLGVTLEDAMAVALAACPYPPQNVPGQPPCSGPTTQARSLLNPVVQLGLLGRLLGDRSTLWLGASLRSAPNLGLRKIFAEDPGVDLPWTVRAGLRFQHRSERGAFADVEVDGVAQVFTRVEAPTPLRNTVGLRLGGSLGMPVHGVVLVARAGFMFDWRLRPPPLELAIAGFGQVMNIATPEIDVFWLSGTLGAGVETRRFAMQLGYGYLSEQVRSPQFGSSRESSHLLSLSALLRFAAGP
jgi:hypothetical protein